ncbi:hypothetical protein B0J11DRAFT_600306 [Dendryphion nanum]|uniref:PLAC8 family protein n=1 Tax=Dendryphion nanum TaxID=256645 RepID=A0A9P9ITR5_9PLEO|nr:hypothetical protein B0J11DRAFT_600306 [Dendryphion nanum]
MSTTTPATAEQLTPVDDFNYWMKQANRCIKLETWEWTPIPGARQWYNHLFECCIPFKLCWSSHHITVEIQSLTPQSQVSAAGSVPASSSEKPDTVFSITECCCFWLVRWLIGCACIMQAMQMQDIREKHNLRGRCMRDVIRAWCCLCCSIIQAEKETKERYLEEAITAGQYKGERMVAPGANVV